MHWVDRGPEPDGLADVRSRYTSGWVEHYRNESGSRPNDSRWRDFHDDLGGYFFGLCGYCEVIARGEVDHFRPKSKFPELVYDWQNWVFACHDCNSAKLNKWPPRGYIDPCSRSVLARPENFFDFDTVSGEIIVKEGLSPIRRQKARSTINDLRLNAFHHMRARLQWMMLVSAYLGNPGGPDSELPESISWIVDRNVQFSSVTRVLLGQLGYSVGDDG